MLHTANDIEPVFVPPPLTSPEMICSPDCPCLSTFLPSQPEHISSRLFPETFYPFHLSDWWEPRYCPYEPGEQSPTSFLPFSSPFPFWCDPELLQPLNGPLLANFPISPGSPDSSSQSEEELSAVGLTPQPQMQLAGDEESRPTRKRKRAARKPSRRDAKRRMPASREGSENDEPDLLPPAGDEDSDKTCDESSDSAQFLKDHADELVGDLDGERLLKVLAIPEKERQKVLENVAIVDPYQEAGEEDACRLWKGPYRRARGRKYPVKSYANLKLKNIAVVRMLLCWGHPEAARRAGLMSPRARKLTSTTCGNCICINPRHCRIKDVWEDGRFLV